MSHEIIVMGAFLLLFVLMILKVPIGVAMGLVGTVGFGMFAGPSAAFGLLAQSPIRTATEEAFSIIPLFILMGAFVSASGMSRELFRTTNAFFGHVRGGLGIATIAACAGFSAICGSSVATAATFSKVAYPELRTRNYSESFATGVIGAGGTLGILIPPSAVLAVYGIITEQDIGKLFIAGLLPGVLATLMYMLTIYLICAFRIETVSSEQRKSWSERLHTLKDIWAVVVLFVIVMGGLYGGVFTTTEAAGIGSFGALVISIARRKLTKKNFWAATIDTVRTTAAVFSILIGALLFSYFLAVSQVPQGLTSFIVEQGYNRYLVLAAILVGLLILGCFMDAMAMIILTVPIILPVILQLGFDPIWFGVVIVIVVELAMITPPVGMNIFVIKSALPETKLTTIIKGLAPFVLTDLIRLALIITFPIIVTALPSAMK